MRTVYIITLEFIFWDAWKDTIKQNVMVMAAS